ncbi:MAG: PQQ-dependent sugar dehydrogenase [Acidobacteriota bacterium]|jgi:glucose/arabinose dehydrogenase|nr:PQQ-dependent sugar dehydrogenase [Acidobacteriota bacterium]
MQLQKIIFHAVLIIFTVSNIACANTAFTDSDSDELPLPKERPQFEVETVATGLEVPWSIVFAPDGRIFVTERPGRIRVIDKDGKLLEKPLFVVKDVELESETGLMGMTLHPNFAENHLLYFAYVYENSGDKFVRVSRYKETGETLTDGKTIIEAIPAAKYHAGMRLGFSPVDKKLYITTGDGTKQKRSQDLSSINGKTLRLNDDGTIPADNPFINTKNARPEIWTYGHRNAQGMDWHPETNLMWQTEHGPSLIDGVSYFKKRTGGDEINIVERGKNYGWAKISHDMTKEGMETPLIEYSPAVAPASGTFYRGDTFPEFKNNFFFGALKGESLIRLVIDGRKITAQEYLLKKKYGRIREVAVSPEGYIYFSTSNRDGRGDVANEDDRILRIVPKK